MYVLPYELFEQGQHGLSMVLLQSVHDHQSAGGQFLPHVLLFLVLQNVHFQLNQCQGDFLHVSRVLFGFANVAQTLLVEGFHEINGLILLLVLFGFLSHQILQLEFDPSEFVVVNGEELHSLNDGLHLHALLNQGEGIEEGLLLFLGCLLLVPELLGGEVGVHDFEHRLYHLPDVLLQGIKLNLPGYSFVFGVVLLLVVRFLQILIQSPPIVIYQFLMLIYRML